VPLSTDNGGASANYGTSCAAANRTRFDDGAATSIVNGTAPFDGLFKPEGLLSDFQGKSGAAANGTWKLHIADDTVTNAGILRCWSLFIRQDDEPTLEAPIALSAYSIVGNQVTLRWAAPPGGPVPTSYVMEAGLSPGQTLAALPTFGASPVFTFTAPTGAFFVRIRALTGTTMSAASNEIPLYVNVPVPPSPPEALQSFVAVANLGLAWRNTFRGGPPSSFVLDVESSPFGAVSVPLSAVDDFFVAAVPPGEYHARLRAANAGGTSAPSGLVIWRVESDCALDAPSTPADFLVYKNGNTIYLIWTPAYRKAASQYIVNVSGSFTGSFPITGRSVSGTVGAGTYNFSVQAANPCGVSAPTAVQSVTIP
jgi:hypothetical protein